jgi:hypothetical protein
VLEISAINRRLRVEAAGGAEAAAPVEEPALPAPAFDESIWAAIQRQRTEREAEQEAEQKAQQARAHRNRPFPPRGYAPG